MTDPVRFDEYQHRCLYDPDGGFYSTGGGAGRRGDFITSPEVGPLFGAVIARAVDTWWEASGSPEVFDLVEVGAGRGALTAAILDAGTGCGTALRPVCVEQSAALRLAASELLGDRAEVRADLPDGTVHGLIVANELLDNLVVRVVERTADGWAEVWVDGSTEVLRATELEIDLDVPPGTRLPVHERAAHWVADVLDHLGPGRLVAIDYGVRATAELVGRPWLRTYSGHGRGVDPLQAPGALDITVDVAFDQLPGDPTITTQRQFLIDNGIDALVEEARAVWHARSHLGDLEAIRARSRVGEADALLDPGGLGAFLVAEWIRP